MIAKETEARLDQLPYAILRLARRRLPAEHRETIHDEEWLPELMAIVQDTEGMPITRVIRGVDFAIGLLFAASRISRALGDTRLPPLDLADAPPFRAEVPARISDLAQLRAALDVWLVAQGIGEYDRFGIVLAAAEAVANAIEHGYLLDESQTVNVLAQVDGDTVAMRIVDAGHWRPPRQPPNDGRGLALIGRLMDDLVIDHGGGTTVLMRRRTSGARR